MEREREKEKDNGLLINYRNEHALSEQLSNDLQGTIEA